VLIVVGEVLLLAGVLFTLQGAGVVSGSAMSGVTLWVVLGPVIALVGLVLLVTGARRRRTS
jgi:hypothetical protein